MATFFGLCFSKLFSGSMKAGRDSDVIIKGAAYSIRGEKTQWHNTVVIFFLSKLKKWSCHLYCIGMVWVTLFVYILLFISSLRHSKFLFIFNRMCCSFLVTTTSRALLSLSLTCQLLINIDNMYYVVKVDDSQKPVKHI